MSHYNNFELLLAAASEQCCDQLSEQLLSADTTNEISIHERKRFNRMLKANERKQQSPWYPFKIAIVATLACLAFCFSACMCIPKVRNVIKEVVIEWYDEYIAIGFHAKDNLDDNQNLAPPSAIINKAYASYLPDAFRSEIDIDTDNYYMISYYADDRFVFSLIQSVITDSLSWSNSEDQKISQIRINGYEAVLIEDLTAPGCYSITWQNESYEFNIMGSFTNMDEAIKIASGISTTE